MTAGSALDGFGSMLEAIDTVPIPGAPIPLQREAAAVGLSFLGTALRQNHIRRLTERLVLVEHLGADCKTEVDLSLSMLDDDQWKAARLFQTLRTRNTDGGSNQLDESTQSHDSGSPTIWVPVSCISRASAAPIDVQDEAGTRLPRLTQYETSTMVAAGMYRLLMRVLASHPDSTTKTDLSRFLTSIHEARWLVRSAVYAILTERAGPTVRESRSATPGTIGGHGRQYRDLAKQILTDYLPLLDSYFALLTVALNDYLLVVSVDARRDEHLLRFDSPLFAEDEQSSLRRVARAISAPRGFDAPRAWWRQIMGSPRNYHLEYEGEIPSNISSYHLVA